MLANADAAFVVDLAARFLVDIVAMAILLFAMYYPRYRDKETATAAALFNVFVFGVLSVLSSVEFSIAAGFGLFAILALFTLRSETITKTEITYFFGSISLAVITAVTGTSLAFVVLVSSMVLLGAFVLDHPAILRSVDSMGVTLDRIPPYLLSEPSRMRQELSSQLGVDVLSFRVRGVDYIADQVRADVFYRKQPHA